MKSTHNLSKRNAASGRRRLAGGLVASAALLLVMAISASAASAAEYRTESAPGYLSATQEGTFTFGLGYTFTCSGAKWSSELPTGKSTILTTSENAFSGCAVAGQQIVAEMNGCGFQYGEPLGNGAINNVSIVCPEGKSMVMNLKTGGCSWSIPPQVLGANSTITNNAGSPKTASIYMNHTLQYTGTGGTCGGGLRIGSIIGNLKVRAFRNPAHTQAVGFFFG